MRYNGDVKIHVKRVYDKSEKSDGTRVLVDRLWPRGISKEDAQIDIWAKDLTPSNELRQWFHKDNEKRYKEFVIKYKAELKEQKESAKDRFGALKKITLVTSVKDIQQSHVPVLESFLQSSK